MKKWWCWLIGHDYIYWSFHFNKWMDTEDLRWQGVATDKYCVRCGKEDIHYLTKY